MMDNTGGSVRQSTRRRTARGTRLLWLGGCASAAVLVALPAAASRIVAVRVGAHAAFTRVVFEFDAAAGYRISRNEPAPGIAELVVTLDAGGPARKVYHGRGLVENVTLVGLGPSGSIARIRLKREGLHLKEMVLRSPPRVVLDILNEPKPVAKAKAKTGASAAGSPPPESARAQAASATPGAVPQTRERLPLPPAGSTGSADSGLSPEQAVEEDAPSDPPPPEGTVTARSEADGASAANTEPPVPAPEPGSSEGREGAAGGAYTAPSPSPRSASRAAPPSRAEESSMDFVTVSLVAAGLVFGAVALLWWRRRASDAGQDFDGDAFDSETSAEFESSEEGADAAADGESEVAGVEAETDGPGVFDLSAHERLAEGDDGVEAVAEVEPVVVGHLSEDGPARLVRELERRIANLETRLDEVVDSRERVERQVAAQTEELRVQRAAIARTQRAVRQLSRAADDAPTEPALRDPGGGSDA